MGDEDKAVRKEDKAVGEGDVVVGERASAGGRAICTTTRSGLPPSPLPSRPKF